MQPFPTKPPAFEQQGLTVDGLIDFTPELRRKAEAILSQYTAGPLFGPPSLVTETNKGTVMAPSTDGGANWQGACFDPETGILYVPSMNRIVSLGLREDTQGRTEFPYVLAYEIIQGPEGLPIMKPPYSRISAIDLNRGEMVWQVPHGDGPRDHPAIKHLNLGPLGMPTTGIGTNGGGVLTKELLFIIQADSDPDDIWGRGTDGVIRAFDKKSGEELWEYRLGKAPYGTPMTYMYDGKQYVVVGVGGSGQPAEYVAFRLKT
jgi:quinoprotein glucose dehydrogenase